MLFFYYELTEHWQRTLAQTFRPAATPISILRRPVPDAVLIVDACEDCISAVAGKLYPSEVSTITRGTKLHFHRPATLDQSSSIKIIVIFLGKRPNTQDGIFAYGNKQVVRGVHVHPRDRS